MKIHLVSDLHLEFLHGRWANERLISPVPESDVLVLAGDIAGGTDAYALFSNWSHDKQIPIVFVAGNHEFYGRDMSAVRSDMRQTVPPGFHYLENDRVEIDGVRFLGTTMWTDYRIAPDMTQQRQMQLAQDGLNDHHLIRTEVDLFSAGDALALHKVARSWLARELAVPFAGKTVVVTHHGCHQFSIHQRFMNDPINAAFVSDLSEFFPHVDLWLHGHVHNSFDYQVGRCRVVANPAGYIMNGGVARTQSQFEFENPNFKRRFMIDLESWRVNSPPLAAFPA